MQAVACKAIQSAVQWGAQVHSVNDRSILQPLAPLGTRAEDSRSSARDGLPAEVLARPLHGTSSCHRNRGIRFGNNRKCFYKIVLALLYAGPWCAAAVRASAPWCAWPWRMARPARRARGTLAGEARLAPVLALQDSRHRLADRSSHHQIVSTDVMGLVARVCRALGRSL